jgi:hypothetical protein
MSLEDPAVLMLPLEDALGLVLMLLLEDVLGLLLVLDVELWLDWLDSEVPALLPIAEVVLDEGDVDELEVDGEVDADAEPLSPPVVCVDELTLPLADGEVEVEDALLDGDALVLDVLPPEAIGLEVETLIWLTTVAPPAYCLAIDSARVRSASVVTVPVRTMLLEVCSTTMLLFVIC